MLLHPILASRDPWPCWPMRKISFSMFFFAGDMWARQSHLDPRLLIKTCQALRGDHSGGAAAGGWNINMKVRFDRPEYKQKKASLTSRVREGCLKVLGTGSEVRSQLHRWFPPPEREELLPDGALHALCAWLWCVTRVTDVDERWRNSFTTCNSHGTKTYKST